MECPILPNKDTKILIVEDDNNLGDTLLEYLEGCGHNVTLAKTAQAARNVFNSSNPDVILMDIELPDGNGLNLARNFIDVRKDFVLLFLSAQNDPEIKLAGLEIGAEDYITKPFALKELKIRLERILKFSSELKLQEDEIQIGDLKIWFKRFEVQDGYKNIITLSQKECAILKKLWLKKNEAVTRDQIIDEIWGEDKYPSQRTVDNYIVTLRKWCETDNTKTIEIQSIRGIGYKLITK